MEQTGGLQGIGVGPTLPTTNTQSTSFKTVVVGWDDDTNPTKFNITVEGKSYSLPLHFTGQTTTIGGYQYKNYAFSADGTPPDASVAKDIAALSVGQYSTVGGFLKAAKTVGSGGNSWSNTGFVLFSVGAVTPIANMPTQILNYEGHWAIITKEGSDNGTFTAQVNFGAKTLTYTVPGGTQGNGTLTGNQFAGTATLALPGGGTGAAEIAGEFYGPNAEEMGGVLTGTGTVGGVANQPIGGIFAGRVH